MKHEYKIKFNTIEQVKIFTNKMLDIDIDVDIRSENNRYVVDAKSIMGILGLDLANNVILEIKEDKDEILEIITELDILVREV